MDRCQPPELQSSLFRCLVLATRSNGALTTWAGGPRRHTRTPGIKHPSDWTAPSGESRYPGRRGTWALSALVVGQGPGLYPWTPGLLSGPAGAHIEPAPTFGPHRQGEADDPDNLVPCCQFGESVASPKPGPHDISPLIFSFTVYTTELYLHGGVFSKFILEEP